VGLFLVTGGAGFIGSHLVDALVQRGDRVRVLDDLSAGKREYLPAAAELRIGDVADPAAVQSAARDVDGIFHLAAIASVQRSNEDWLGTHRANLTGTIVVFDAARRARSGLPVPVVYASSAAVYGSGTEGPLTEDSPTRPLTAYGADKLGGELHARVAASVHGVPATGLRLFNVYGPRQDSKSPYSGVISIFADRIRSGLGIAVHGDGGQTRDFVFVADVVRHIEAAMATSSGPEARIFTVCTGRATSILTLAKTLMDATGRRVAVSHVMPRQGDIRESLGDPSRAIRELGIASTTSLASGLAATLRVP
jgi:UDP-glucose 4-epimerase